MRSPQTGRAVAFLHIGHVGGTFTSGSRDNDWDELGSANPRVAQFFDDYANAGHLESHLEYTSNIGSALESTLGWLAKFAFGGESFGWVIGAVVFVGVEVVSLISTGSLVPGARLIGNILWMAGPENTLFAIVAEGIASVGSRTRELTQEEYDWANGMKDDPDPKKAQSQVFAGSLPPREKLVLTDTIGPGNRAFTFPRFDGKITLNMGADAFNDPRKYQEGTIGYGAVFIHELVHACQIQHSRELALLADALATKLCEAGGGKPYNYGTPDQEYTELNIEQQAQIVEDWFSARKTAFGQTGVAKDKKSPYFRYIVENVRIGKF